MSEDLARLTVALDARIDQFERKIARAEKKLTGSSRKMEKTAQTLDKRLAAVGQRFGVAFPVSPMAAATAAAGGLVVALDRTISTLDEIGKTADRLGLTTTALQELRSAATQSGVQTRTLDMAMQRFGRRLAEARQGAGEARGALEEMGIALVDADGRARGVEDVLDDVADAMAGMSEQTDRNRIAMRLFDSEGVALVNMLRNGAAGLREMRDAAGNIIPESAIRDAETLRTEIDVLTESLQNRLLITLGSVSSALNSLFNLGGPAREVRVLTEQLEKLEEKLVQSFLIDAPPSLVQGRDRLQSAIENTKAEIARLQAEIPADPPPPAGPAAVTPAATAAGSGGVSEADRRAEAEAAVLDRLVEQAVRYAELEARIGQSDDALQDLIARQEAYAIVGDEVTAATVEQAEALIEGRRRYEELTEAAADAARTAEDRMRVFDRAIGRVGDAITEMAVSGKADFRGLVDSILADIARLAIQQSVTEPLADILGTVASAALGSVTGAPAAPAAAAAGGQVVANINKRASGGPVSAGVPYVVGEQGRELFVPETAGRVLNAAQMRGAAATQMIDEAQPRASGGPVSAGVPYVVGEQGRELFVPETAGRVLNAAQMRGAAAAQMIGEAQPRASGGPVSAGVPYVVGEQGRELFVPDVAGQVLNAAQMRGAARGGGSAPAVVQVELSGDLDARVATTSRDVAVQVTRAGIEEYDRRVLPSRVAQVRNDPRRRG